MATTGDGLFFGVFEGCIGAGDALKERRPYHRNCGCALHDRSRGGACPHASPRVSYPMRRAWSEGSLALAAQRSGSSANSSPSQQHGSNSSPALGAAEGRKSTGNLMALAHVEEEEEC